MNIKTKKKSKTEQLGIKISESFEDDPNFMGFVDLFDNVHKKGKIIDNIGGGFDIVSTINKITPENIEFHLSDEGEDNIVRKMSFCGPNTNLKKRLINYVPKTGKHDGIHEWSKPINELDRGCYLHDISYSKFKDKENRIKADEELIKVTNNVINNPNSTTNQIFNANLVKMIMRGKVFLGIGNNIQYGGSLDNINQLISDAQKQAQSSSFNSPSPIGAKVIGTLVPLIILATSIGIPALLSKIEKKKDE